MSFSLSPQGRVFSCRRWDFLLCRDLLCIWIFANFYWEEVRLSTWARTKATSSRLDATDFCFSENMQATWKIYILSSRLLLQLSKIAETMLAQRERKKEELFFLEMEGPRSKSRALSSFARSSLPSYPLSLTISLLPFSAMQSKLPYMVSPPLYLSRSAPN